LINDEKYFSISTLPEKAFYPEFCGLGIEIQSSHGQKSEIILSIN
jgi:hypothetical protein